MRIFAKHTFVFVLQWRPRCGWWTGRVLTRAAWRFSTNAAGGRCVTTPGTRRTGTWCAGCWDTEGPLMSTRPGASDSVRDAHHARRRVLEGSVAILENKERVTIQQEMKKEHQIFPGWSSLSGVMLSVPYDAAGINIKVLWGKSCEPDVVKKSLRGRIRLPLSLHDTSLSLRPGRLVTSESGKSRGKPAFVPGAELQTTAVTNSTAALNLKRIIWDLNLCFQDESFTFFLFQSHFTLCKQTKPRSLNHTNPCEMLRLFSKRSLGGTLRSHATQRLFVWKC